MASQAKEAGLHGPEQGRAAVSHGTGKASRSENNRQQKREGQLQGRGEPGGGAVTKEAGSEKPGSGEQRPHS